MSASAKLYNTSKLTNKQLRAHFRIVNAHSPFPELAPDEFSQKYARRCKRYGKTARDHANGNQHRSMQRRMARASWQQAVQSSAYNAATRESLPAFPN